MWMRIYVAFSCCRRTPGEMESTCACVEPVQTILPNHSAIELPKCGMICRQISKRQSPYRSLRASFKLTCLLTDQANFTYLHYLRFNVCFVTVLFLQRARSNAIASFYLFVLELTFTKYTVLF